MKKLRRAGIILCLAAHIVACGGASTSRTDVDAVVNRWHRAAAEADADTYFGLLHRDAVFIGTDASERWSKEAFQSYAMPYFKRGKAWTMIAKSRHVKISANGAVAWFDEVVRHTKYGDLRGSGVLVNDAGTWRLAHYVLSIPVPNSVSGKVIELIGKAADVKPRQSGTQ